ncbi:insulinase family protein, partial [candidate division KSB1 bacterium]|nr:insulinase family protein [candidate division KSB1 bacterium]
MSDIQRIIRNNRAGVTILVALIVLFALPITAFNQQIADPEHAKTAGLEEKMPIGPNVKVGVLDNGLKYYIRKNSRPENRALLRLVVNVGSITEDDDQLGLAHFVEHMAFNGSENFEKQELVDFMESIGMRFGPGLNASTSFDETIYMLQIPTESSEVIETAFQILEDWAHGQIFDHEEIDKERGVVIEEWRMGRGDGSRIRDKQFPIIFKDSQYAKRLPIGTLE